MSVSTITTAIGAAANYTAAADGGVAVWSPSGVRVLQCDLQYDEDSCRHVAHVVVDEDPAGAPRIDFRVWEMLLDIAVQEAAPRYVGALAAEVSTWAVAEAPAQTRAAVAAAVAAAIAAMEQEEVLWSGSGTAAGRAHPRRPPPEGSHRLTTTSGLGPDAGLLCTVLHSAAADVAVHGGLSMARVGGGCGHGGAPLTAMRPCELILWLSDCTRLYRQGRRSGGSGRGRQRSTQQQPRQQVCTCCRQALPAGQPPSVAQRPPFPPCCPTV